MVRRQQAIVQPLVDQAAWDRAFATLRYVSRLATQLCPRSVCKSAAKCRQSR